MSSVADLRLVLRVDGNEAVGFGHVARCLALAEAWRSAGGEVDVLADSLPQAWVERYETAGVHRRTVDAMTELADARAVLLLDGYALAATARDAASLRFGAVAALDDFGIGGQGPSLCLVIDQSSLPSAPVPPTYAGAARLLRGPRYAMLRSEFGRQPDRSSEVRGRLLVSLGGAPDARARSWAAQVLTELPPGIEPMALTGVQDVPGLMATSQVALAAAGSTTWELCRVGVPGLFVAVSDNQIGVMETVAAAGVGEVLGAIDEVDPKSAAASVVALMGDGARRAEFSARGRRLVDAGGSRRVCAALRSSLLTVRAAVPEDKERYFLWANDEATRASAFHPEPIPWTTHDAWFDARMADPDTLLLVVMLGNTPIGHFRVDVAGESGLVGIVVGSEVRGRGLGAAVVDAGVRAAYRTRPELRRLRAEVLTSNEPSRRAFVSADFDLESEDQRDGRAFLVFVRPRIDERDR